MIKLTAFNIKVLAAVFMLMDHVYSVLMPNLVILHYVGRLSFPLFAWLLAEGEKHTRNIYRYGSRLLIAAIISQPIYIIVFRKSFLNILFTLLIGLIMLRLVRRYPRLLQQIPMVGLCALIAEIFRCEYGAYGIGVIFLMSLTDKLKPAIWALSWCILHFVAFVASGNSLAQNLAIFAGIIVFQFNSKQGPRARWFYAFYPGHLLILGLIRHFIFST
ncbi:MULTISPECIES: TraX family protein [Calothrix]|uniref:TraX family protein n=2 Tax=Calothrix TaxID=1186 RepID=A0ABR8A659_9CYAN|nr:MULTISPECIES: TraX family protein [Calothrix]MBD2195485.1 TraX family protein [Calothrix parietina FACHB-288]MBD2228427.1 TraX family protein [Calothrix anomala FACHB-343]